MAGRNLQKKLAYKGAKSSPKFLEGRGLRTGCSITAQAQMALVGVLQKYVL
jgi:hypothetical protein